jgi:chromate reductase
VKLAGVIKVETDLNQTELNTSSMDKPIAILGFAGSLRKNSYNKALLRAATKLVPDNTQLSTFDIKGIPPFNQDLENKPPEKVKEFKNRIRAADALPIVTPEYNYSIPGVLKNAIDWASRPASDNVLIGKPVAIMGASTGRLGTARAQYHLRQCLVGLNMYPVNKPEVFVAYADEKIAENGRLKDDETRKYIVKLLKNLATWTKKLKK